MRIELAEEAEQDLEDIQLYGLQNFGVVRAARYDQALDNAMATIAEHPGIGKGCGIIRADLRRYECMSHAIYYRPVPDGIRVLRVLHKRMDPGLHLG